MKPLASQAKRDASPPISQAKRDASPPNHWIPLTEMEVDAKERFAIHFMNDFLRGRLEANDAGRRFYVRTGRALSVQGDLFAHDMAAEEAAPYGKLGGEASGFTSEAGRFASYFTSEAGRFASYFTSEAGRFAPYFTSEAGRFAPYFTSEAGRFASYFTSEAERFAPYPYNGTHAVMDAGRELWRYYHAQPLANPNASFNDIRRHFQGVSISANGIERMNNDSKDETYNALFKDLRENMKQLAKKIEPKVYEYGFLK